MLPFGLSGDGASERVSVVVEELFSMEVLAGAAGLATGAAGAACVLAAGAGGAAACSQPASIRPAANAAR